MQSESLSSQVAISGGGPVGLSLALALIKKGLSVKVFESGDDLCEEMRASTIHASTLEMFAHWGVLPQLLDAGQITRNLQYWERQSRQKIAEFSFDLLEKDTPYPFRLQCPQNILARILKNEIERLAPGTVLLGHEVVGHQQDDGKVTVSVRHNNQDTTFTAEYLVGCDGSRSTVRKGLGVKLHGETHQDRFLLVGTTIDFSKFFKGLGPVAYLYDPKEWVILLKLPGLLRTVFRLPPDEDEKKALEDSAVRKRMANLMGETLEYEIKLTKIYSVHQRVADTFRQGRVILAGDAAHLNNPVGGMGLNSGVHDACMLSTILEQVIHGKVPDSQLDHYSKVRRDLAIHAIQDQSGKNYADMIAKAWNERDKRNNEMATTAANPEMAREYLRKAAMLDVRPSLS